MTASTTQTTVPSSLKVLHVYRTYHPDPIGGLQEAIRQISSSCQPLGIESRIFTLSPDPHPKVIQRPEGQVIRTRSWLAPASCDIGGPAAFAEFSRQAKWADVINYHFPWPFADMLHLITRPDTPAIITYHSDIVRQKWLGSIYSPLMKTMLDSMKFIVATSPNYAQTSEILNSIPGKERIHVIPLGIEESSYPDRGDDNILQRLGLVEDEPFFLFVGVLRYYKGLRTLIKAAPSVPAKIVIAGTGPEGNYIEDQIKEQGLKNIVLAGQITDAEKVSLLEHCTTLVLPSHLRSEAFGVVLIEASMFSKPMISCEIGTGTSFVNKHGETGYVVEPNTPAQIADAMNRLLSSPETANKFGAQARKRYEQLFSGSALGSAYSELYKKAICS